MLTLNILKKKEKRLKVYLAKTLKKKKKKKKKKIKKKWGLKWVEENPNPWGNGEGGTHGEWGKFIIGEWGWEINIHPINPHCHP